MQLQLWDGKNLASCTVPAKKPLAQFVAEQTILYGVNESETIGLIATILGGNIPDKTLNTLMGKTIRELSQMTEEELGVLPGIGRSKAVRFAAVFELARRLASTPPEEKMVIKSPDDVAKLVMEEMRYLDREHLKALLLNTKNNILAIDNISVGTLDSSVAHPREVFKNALKRSAAAVILVHNHPSGDCAPSREDIDATNRFVEAGKIIGIEVLDHIIIGDGKFTSVKTKGLM